MYYLRPLCPEKQLKNVYHALFESRIGYGISCWGGTYLNTIRPLIITQKHCIRIIKRRRRTDHAFPLFQDLHLLPLRHLYVFRVLRIFYLRSGNRNDGQLTHYRTRLQDMGHILTPRPEKEVYQKFYTYLSRRLFNSLPQTLRTSFNTESLHRFGARVKEWLFENADIEGWFNFRL